MPRKKPNVPPKSQIRSPRTNATVTGAKSDQVDNQVTALAFGPPIFRVEKELTLTGYTVDCDALAQINEAATASVESGNRDDSAAVTFVASVTTNEDDHRIEFSSLDAMVKHVTAKKISIKDMSLDYRVGLDSRVSIELKADGNTMLSGYGTANDFPIQIKAVERELMECDQHFHFVIASAVFGRTIRRLLVYAVSGVSVFLLFNVVYFFYGWQVGVDVDPHLLPKGNAYFQNVEAALKSPEIEQKLDALLQGQLRGFSNISNILARTRALILASVVILVCLVVAILLLRYLIRLYPRAYFAIGHNVNALEKIKRQRDVVITAVIIAFAVNVVAGIVVAFVAG